MACSINYYSNETHEPSGCPYREDYAYCHRRGPKRLVESIYDDMAFSEDDVFMSLVESGGFSCVSRFLEESTYENENFLKWLAKGSTQLSVYKRNGIPIFIGPFLKHATICFEHIEEECTRHNCGRFHICTFFLNGVCKYGRRCNKGHNYFDDHNKQIIENLGLEDLSEKEIQTIILCRYPQVCRNDSCSFGEDCPYLHICYDFINNKCETVSCERGHSFQTPHNRWVLKVYKMDRWPKDKLLSMKGSINMPRRQNRIRYSNQTTDQQHNDMLRNSSIQKQQNLKPAKREGKPFLALTSLSDDDAHNKYICHDQVQGNCSMACDKHHANLPYVWQIYIFGQWVRFDDCENQNLEHHYCRLEQTANGQVNVDGIIYEINIEFDKDIGTIVSRSQKLEQSNIRRLSTASYAMQDSPSPRGSFHTQWRWYFVNDHQEWILFNKDELQYTLERKYITGQNSYLFTRKSNRFKYRISFPDMVQANLDSSTVRAILRRPIFVSHNDVKSQRHPQTLRIVDLGQHPLEWTVLDLAHEFELVELEETLGAYVGVEAAFYASLDKRNIRKG